MASKKVPEVVIVIGSNSDRKSVDESGMLDVLNQCAVDWQMSIISAHRHPDKLKEYCQEMVNNGVLVFIGVAGMSAALPGAIAAYTKGLCPVIGVALTEDKLFGGLDALLAMTRLPLGTAVATVGLDKTGLYNAAKLAVQIICLTERAGKDYTTNFEEKLEELVEDEAKKRPFTIAVAKGE